jgi:hypothetical protein
MKHLRVFALLIAVMALAVSLTGCYGSVGMSIPIGGGYGGWGPSMNVGVSVPFGYPY